MRILRQDNATSTLNEVSREAKFFRAHCVKFPRYYFHSDQPDESTRVDIFGRLQQNWAHTIVTRQMQTGGAITYQITEETFDPYKSDRLFLDYPKTHPAEFDKYFLQAARATRRYGRFYSVWYQLKSWTKRKIFKQCT